MAAEKTGRAARLIEYDAAYCDTIIRRWQTYTGKHATLASTGERFEDVVQARNALSDIIKPKSEIAADSRMASHG